MIPFFLLLLERKKSYVNGNLMVGDKFFFGQNVEEEKFLYIGGKKKTL